MSMKLSQVQGRESTTTVQWNGETVDVGFYPARMTPALLEDVQEAAKAGSLDVLGTMLEPVLAWWDVLDDEDRRLPTDGATIKSMPLGFITAVITEVQGALRPPASRA